MTVSELIDKLQALDPTLLVRYWDDYDYRTAEGVQVTQVCAFLSYCPAGCCHRRYGKPIDPCPGHPCRRGLSEAHAHTIGVCPEHGDKTVISADFVEII